MMADHDNVYGGRGPGFLALSWTISIVANILIGLRAYVYLRIKLNGGWALFWVIFADVSAARSMNLRGRSLTQISTSSFFSSACASVLSRQVMALATTLSFC